MRALAIASLLFTIPSALSQGGGPPGGGPPGGGPPGGGPPGGGPPGGGPPGGGPGNGNAVTTCAGLQTSLGSTKVQTASGPNYVAGATSAWDIFNTVQRPACIVFPTSTNDVSLAMQAIFQNKIRYAVQAGGHSPMKDWNNVQGGILFNFSQMKAISYDAAKGSITFQPGIRWGEAITALASQGVAPLGGRVPDVGTGLLLGGGLNYMSGEHGFSSDVYREVDVVLVDGQVVTATATNIYSDLFRALKGGANRFGIITRYEVDAIQTGTPSDKNYFGGTILYGGDAVPAILDAMRKYVKNVNDPKAALLTVLGRNPDGSSLNPTTIVYHGTALPPGVYDDFLAIPALFSQIGPLSWQEAMNLLGTGESTGIGNLWGATVLGENAPLSDYAKLFQVWDQYSEDLQATASGGLSIIALTPVQRSQILAGRSRGGNIIDPPLQNYNAILTNAQFLPNVTSLAPPVLGRQRRLLANLPRTPGLPLYVNECDANQAVFATYGRYEELKRTYRKYDPTRFNVRFTDGPIGL